VKKVINNMNWFLKKIREEAIKEATVSTTIKKQTDDIDEEEELVEKGEDNQ